MQRKALFREVLPTLLSNCLEIIEKNVIRLNVLKFQHPFILTYIYLIMKFDFFYFFYQEKESIIEIEKVLKSTRDVDKREPKSPDMKKKPQNLTYSPTKLGSPIQSSCCQYNTGWPKSTNWKRS